MQPGQFLSDQLELLGVVGVQGVHGHRTEEVVHGPRCLDSALALGRVEPGPHGVVVQNVHSHLLIVDRGLVAVKSRHVVGTDVLSERRRIRRPCTRVNATGWLSGHLDHCAHPAERVLPAMCQAVFRSVRLFLELLIPRHLVSALVIPMFVTITLSFCWVICCMILRLLFNFRIRSRRVINSRHGPASRMSIFDDRHVSLDVAEELLSVSVLEVCCPVIRPMERPSSVDDHSANADDIDSVGQQDGIDGHPERSDLSVHSLVGRDHAVRRCEVHLPASLVDPRMIIFHISP